MLVNVLLNADKSAVVGYFASPQDQGIWAGFAQIDVSDSRYKIFYDAQSPFAQAGMTEPT